MDLAQHVLLFYLYGAAAVVLFFLALLWQQMRIRKLEKELDDITYKFQSQAGAPTQLREELFAACPYPVCFVDMKGRILAANGPFYKVSAKDVKSLTDFDRHTGGELAHIVLAGRLYTHRLATLRKEGESGLRQFNVVSWPVWGPQVQTGAVLSFHEQTQVLRRKGQQLQFEQQLVSYLAFLAIQLGQLAEARDANHTVTLDAYSKEIHLLISYLQQVHHHLRQPNPHGVLDVTKLCRELVQEYRTELRAKHVQLITTFPTEAKVVAHHADLQLAMRTLLAAVLQHADHTTDLRLNVYAQGRRTAVELLLPERLLTAKETEHAFGFGIHGKDITSEERLRRLQLAMAREIIGKYNGHITVQSHPTQGTLYRVILVSAAKE